MIEALLCAIALCAPAAEQVRWYTLDLGTASDPLTGVKEEQARSWAKEQGWSFSMEEAPETARPIGYAGEEGGLLWTLLGVQVLDAGAPPRDLWLASPELEFRVSGLGMRVAGNKAFCRALIAPLSGKRWLLGVDSPAALSEENLRKNLKSPAVRKSLAQRLQNLLRDGHAARNSGKPKPARLGYPGLGENPLLEIGDLESEEAFSLQVSGKAQRKIERLGEMIDDGIEIQGEGAIRFEIDLHSLISDDLILFGRAGNTQEAGQWFVDGLALAEWKPQPPSTLEQTQWLESVARFPNRLLAGKEKAVFELRPAPGATISLYRLQIRRLPPPHGVYLSTQKAISGEASKDRSAGSGPLSCGGYRFFWGLGVQTPSDLSYKIEPSWKELETFVGVEDGSPEPATGAVTFQIFVDGEMRAQSKPLKRGDPPQTLRASLEGGKTIRLVVTPKNPGGSPLLVNWLEIRAFE